MIEGVKAAFDGMLETVEWMDSETRKVAKEKVWYFFVSLLSLIDTQRPISKTCLWHAVRVKHIWTDQENLNCLENVEMLHASSS